MHGDDVFRSFEPSFKLLRGGWPREYQQSDLAKERSPTRITDSGAFLTREIDGPVKPE